MTDGIKILNEKKVYENAYGSLFDDEVSFTSSGTKGSYVRWSWKAPYSVAILPLVSPSEAVLIESFRHSARKLTIEVPKGFGESDAEPFEVATKELTEETGLRSDNLEYLGVTFADPAFANQPMHLFIAHNCEPGNANHETSEAIVGLKNVRIAANVDLMKSEVADAISLLLISIAIARVAVK